MPKSIGWTAIRLRPIAMPSGRMKGKTLDERCNRTDETTNCEKTTPRRLRDLPLVRTRGNVTATWYAVVWGMSAQSAGIEYGDGGRRSRTARSDDAAAAARDMPSDTRTAPMSVVAGVWSDS